VAPEVGAVQETLILVGLTRTALRLVGGLAATTVRFLVAEDQLLDTLHTYVPASLIATLSVLT